MANIFTKAIGWGKRELDDIVADFDGLIQELFGHAAVKRAEAVTHDETAVKAVTDAAAARDAANRADKIAGNLTTLIAK